MIRITAEVSESRRAPSPPLSTEAEDDLITSAGADGVRPLGSARRHVILIGVLTLLCRAGDHTASGRCRQTPG